MRSTKRCKLDASSSSSTPPTSPLTPTPLPASTRDEWDLVASTRDGGEYRARRVGASLRVEVAYFAPGAEETEGPTIETLGEVLRATSSPDGGIALVEFGADRALFDACGLVGSYVVFDGARVVAHQCWSGCEIAVVPSASLETLAALDYAEGRVVVSRREASGTWARVELACPATHDPAGIWVDDARVVVPLETGELALLDAERFELSLAPPFCPEELLEDVDAAEAVDFEEWIRAR